MRRLFNSMPLTLPRNAQYVATLSSLVFRGSGDESTSSAPDLTRVYPDVAYVSALGEAELKEFLRLADAHHVTVRALQTLDQAAATLRGRDQLRSWCQRALANERDRIINAVEHLTQVCQALEAAGAPVAVIKSLDHWPDLGSDLDLYTSGDEQTLLYVMTEQFKARLEPRSWGDRLANKWNFKLPGLPELVEVHVRYLGQTGEQKALARRVIERSVARTVADRTFRVPAPEERVIISTLQRMYRHLYFRLCDMADFAKLIGDGAIDFRELQKAAELGGIWLGVATFLLLISKYVNASGGPVVELPPAVLAAVPTPDVQVRLGGQFLRVPKRPAAALYGSQLLSAGRHADLRAIFRLPLLPPLAISALLAYRLTGNDKGVW
ncbi:MAG TPA: nucleotidyltransferase family protein [Terriglobales bacterium]|nr:nucleotidyltransferase family protein [Terriglobales bacterium]